MSRTEEILKGCKRLIRKEYNTTLNEKEVFCDEDELCESCQAKLQERKLALEEMKNELKDVLRIGGFNCCSWLDNINAELKLHEAKA